MGPKKSRFCLLSPYPWAFMCLIPIGEDLCAPSLLPPQSSPLGLVWASSHHYFQEVASSVLILGPSCASSLLPGGCLLVLIHHPWACYSPVPHQSSLLPGGCLLSPLPWACYVPHHYCQEGASPVLILRSVMFLITMARRLPPQFLSFSLLCASTLLPGGCYLSSCPLACYVPQHYCQEVATSVLILWSVMCLITIAKMLSPHSSSVGYYTYASSLLPEGFILRPLIISRVVLLLRSNRIYRN